MSKVARRATRNGSLSLSSDGKTLAFTRVAMHHPARGVRRRRSATARRRRPANLSKANSRLLAALDLPQPESVTVKGAGGTPMQMWILKPPGFDAKKKWPLAYLVHGGPQGAWEDGWSFRWSPQLWAAQGYVVALPNPRGSTGFGQKYVDEISGDWGGKCYEDLMKGVEYLEKLPYVDKDRIGVGGGVVRRLHDELVRGQHGPVQDPDHALQRLELRQHVRARRTSSGSTSGSTAARRGARTAKSTRSTRRTGSPATWRSSRRRC